MGFIDLFSKGFKAGTERAHNESYRRRDMKNFPVKLVEPSSGRIVELQVTEQNDFAANLCMKQLKNYAECLEQYGVQWTVTGNTIRLTFSDGTMAENVRESLRK